MLGGSGQRFQGRFPKQFITLPGDEHPLYINTLISLTKQIDFDKIILVLHKDYVDKPEFTLPLEKFRVLCPGVPIDILPGGSTRHESFLNGMRRILSEFESGYVAVHDANRPFISAAFALQIRNTMKLLSGEKPCFIPVLSSTDSLCETENGKVTAYMPREHVKQIQTPQLLHIPSLREAIGKIMPHNSFKDFTDEGSFMLSMGYPVYSFSGDPANKKITYPGDIP